MSGTEVPACACAPTHQVVCACGVFSCSNCGAAQQQSAHIVARLGLLDGSYFGNPSQNPLCTNCRGRPELDRRHWALRPEHTQRLDEGQTYGPPLNFLTQARVTNAQFVPENEPLRTWTEQPRDHQQPEGGEQHDQILTISRRLRGYSLTGRARESSESPNQTNQGAVSSFTVGRQSRARQPEEEQPAQTTKQARTRERYERFTRTIEEERQRQRQREQERRQEQFQRRRETELRVQNAQLVLENELMRLEAQHQFVGVEPGRRESFARAGLLQLLKQRQRQERQREGSQSQTTTTTTTTTSDKITKETSKQCTICVETYTNVQDSFPFPPALQQCSEHHDMVVCVLCLCYNIKSQVESRGSAACNDLKCPNLGCDHVYTHKQVWLLSDPDTFALYDQFCLNTSLAMEVNFRRCLRGRCTNGQIYDDLDPDSPYGNRILCSVCGFVMCFKHHCPWHQDLTCDEYDLRRKDGDKETENWLAEKTKPCPNCNIPIEKGTGCFHMTCRACRYEFCWECLADWRTARSSHVGHRPDCFFRKRAAPPPTAMVGSTIVEAQRNRERAAQIRARIDGLLEP
ncbi:hypothetical protein B0J15DRAFT_523487 [Fusarium solani]|uniref:RBR-type E3 ubiquitin transferase n=1 Tax=Fusarium solani TaxID=169388 RepID=A0A9P9HYZ8_FUSSL|nr:uncharacterized protein B0J15DRAFT_523487 [Fusarium solani]KAH7265966.1 hypothetical protein B0J15DRAFT_523487 [Fusarium solani]